MAHMVGTITPVSPRKNITKGEKERKVTRMFYLISNNREKNEKNVSCDARFEKR